MNHIFKIPVIGILLISLTLCLISCKKKPTLPVVVTTNVSGITQTTATSGGNVTSDGNTDVTTRGVCWGTSQNPTTSSSKTSDGTGTGAFTSNITGLTPGTNYYVRAYATNSEGTSYGSQVSFASNPIILATLTTTAVTSITGSTGVSGGNITADGGGAITARGVCWSTSTNPTTANTKTTNGSGIGSFTSNIANLQPSTTYYVKAYAINSSGTAYVNEVSFKTLAVLPILTTTAVTGITASTALSGGNITSDGGDVVTVRGVCWSTSTDPTVTNSHTSDGIGIGSFTSIITGLISNTSYYVRAYATNGVGTTYGNQQDFKTAKETGKVSDIDGNTYNTIKIGTQWWMSENLKTTKYSDGTNIPNVIEDIQWWNLSTDAYCWYLNDPGSYKNTYGALYNWYAVNTGKLCPTGWHVPSRSDWFTLIDHLGGIENAANKLKSTTLWPTGENGTNESGFTAYPGGERGFFSFRDLGSYVYWWSTTSYDVNIVWHLNISPWVIPNYIELITTERKGDGNSVRCLKD